MKEDKPQTIVNAMIFFNYLSYILIKILAKSHFRLWLL